MRVILVAKNVPATGSCRQVLRLILQFILPLQAIDLEYFALELVSGALGLFSEGYDEENM
jgi:hypothetical protein